MDPQQSWSELPASGGQGSVPERPGTNPAPAPLYPAPPGPLPSPTSGYPPPYGQPGQPPPQGPYYPPAYSMPPQMPYSMPGYPMAGPPPSPKRSPALGIILGVSAAVVVLIAILVVVLLNHANGPSTGNTNTSTTSMLPTATSQPTISTAGLDATFTSPDGVYTFQYPSGWTTQAYNTAPVVNGEFVISPGAQDYALTLPLNTDASSQYPAFFSSFLTGFGGTNVNVTSTGNETLGSNTWERYHATFTKNGTPWEGDEYALTHNGTSFVAIVLSPHSSWSADSSTYFQPIISTITFLK